MRFAALGTLRLALIHALACAALANGNPVLEAVSVTATSTQVAAGQTGIGVSMVVTNTGSSDALITTSGLTFGVSIGTGGWSAASPATKPPARVFSALAADPSRDKLVVFAGTTDFSAGLTDTWEWDGTVWTQRTSASVPSARFGHAMAYDPVGGKMLMFGGGTGGSVTANSQDTWHWDGTIWNQLSPSSKPSIRSLHAMASDTIRNRVVLFGGGTSFGGSTVFSGTWEWDGTTWNQLSPATSPSGRNRHGMAFDPARGKTVLYGGFNGSSVLSDTWEWDGTNWAQRSPATNPGARIGLAMAYNAERGTVAIVGDNNATQATWEFDGDNWLQIAGTQPAGRRYPSMAYDAPRRKTVLFGGDGGSATALQDTHLLSGSTASVSSEYTVSASPSNPVTVAAGANEILEFTVDISPTATLDDVIIDGFVVGTNVGATFTTRDDNAATTDSWTVSEPPALSIQQVSAASVQLSQGQTGVAVSMTVTNSSGTGADITDATLKFGISGPVAWSQASPATAPPARAFHTMSTDPGRDRLVVFGGTPDFSTSLSDTWEWDGTNWDGSSPSTAPSARLGHATAYDPVSGKTLLFGGGTGATAAANKQDTWHWNGTAWTELSPSSKPSIRSLHGMATDTGRNRVVLFGGGTSFGGSTVFGDTWEWDGTTWTQRSPATSPVGRNRHGMAYDSARGKVVIFGGADGVSALQDTWEWDGTNWAQVLPATSPSARIGPAMAFDANRGKIVILGDNNATQDSWEFDGTTWTQIVGTQPVGRRFPALAYDDAREKTVLFAGVSGSAFKQDTHLLAASFTDLTHEYTVTPSGGNPATLAGGSGGTFDFTVDVSPTATIGTIEIDGFVSGTQTGGSFITSDAAAAVTDAWLVQAAATLEVVSVVAADSTVVRGQTGRTVTLSVTNSGEATAVEVSVSPKFFAGLSDVTSDYTVSASGSHATSIAGGATESFAFTVAVKSTATTGAITLEGSATGKDFNSDAVTSDDTATTNDSWTVLAPAALSIGSVSATATTVVRGQSGLTVTMSVTNTGSSTAAVTAVSPQFFSASTDKSADYLITASSGNPTSLQGGETQTFTFTVDVLAAATTGSIAIKGTVTGADSVTSASTSDSTPDSSDSWTVVTPAALSIVSVSAAATEVSRGQSGLTVTMDVTNTGGSSANVSSATPKFRSGLTDRTSDYQISQVGSVPAIAAGATQTFTFTVDVGASAATGAITIDGFVDGTDAVTSAATSDSSAGLTDSWLVRTAAQLSVDSVVTTSTRVSQGQSGLRLEVTVTNSGETDAAQVSVSPKMLSNLIDATADYGISAAGASPTTIGAGQSVTYGFDVSVGSQAATGPVTLDASVTGQDEISGAVTSDASAAQTDSWTVQSPAAVRLDSVSADEDLVTQGESGLTITLSVSNTGEATASLTTAAVSFHSGGFGGVPGGDRDGDYTVAPSSGNPGEVPGGASAQLAFDVSVKPTAATGLVSIRGRVSATDVNSGAGSSDSSPTTSDSWTVQAPALLQLTTVVAEDARVTQGQSGRAVRVTIRNAGGASASVTTAALDFSNAGTPVTTFYAFSLASSLPVTLSGGESATLSFAVDVASNAPVGLTTLDAVASGQDQATGASLQASGATTPGEWTVLAPGLLRIVSAQLASAVTRGQTAAASVSLENAGGTTLTVQGVALGFAAAGLSAQADSQLPSLAAGEVATVTFTVSAALTSTPGAAVASASASAVDAAGNGTSDALASAGSIAVLNNAPTADAGADPIADSSFVATFDGSASFDGPSAALSEGDSLTYTWRIVSKPQDSSLTAGSFTTNGASTALTSLTLDKTGTYVVGLVVSDGFDSSAEDTATVTVTIAVANERPVAVASTSTPLVAPGAAAALSGAGSSDDGPPASLTYTWSFESVPQGSALTGGNIQPNGSAAAVAAAFTPDRKGAYSVRLVVGDGILESLPATVTVTRTNAPPVVSASATGPVTLGATVSLSASGSDPDGDALFYSWSVASQPAGSALTDDDIAPNGTTDAFEASFVPDVAGSYVLAVFADDPDGGSAVATVTAVVEPAVVPAPRAVIVPPAALGGPRTIVLDGSRSTGGSLTFAWTLTSKPAGAAEFSSPDALTSYQAIVAGTYTFTLSVIDELLRADTASVTVEVRAASEPVADARGDVTILLTRPGLPEGLQTTSTAILDGTASFDADGDALTYRWRLISAPDVSAGSSAPSTLVTLDFAQSVRPVATFSTALVGGIGSRMAAAGAYRFELTVSDGKTAATDTVDILALDPLNLLPRADAGLSRTVRISRNPDGSLAASIPDPTLAAPDNLRAFVRLTGRESADPAGRPLTYSWRLAGAPASSGGPLLSQADTAFPSFVPDVEGIYVFELTVNNGLYDGAPATVEILVESSNRPPTALAFVEDLTLPELRRSSVARPLLVFLTGETVVLDGTQSTDGDLADRGRLGYRWSQLSGATVVLAPSATTATVSFVAATPGRRKFELTVRDPAGAEDMAEVEVAIIPAGSGGAQQTLPVISIVASATTTIATGEDLPEGLTTQRRRSLRVTVPTTVTLSAALTTPATPGQRFDWLWRQLQGPTVQLSSTQLQDTLSTAAVTSFSPTTSRVHLFELSLFPLDGSGNRTGLFATRRIRVIVDTSGAAVPEATGVVSVATIPLSGSEQERTITLDGTASQLIRSGSGTNQTLTYQWRQLDGPRGVFSNEFAAITQFTAPEFPGEIASRSYLFELTVDATPPGDRSEPVFLEISQGAAAAPGVSGTPLAGTYGKYGGGCALNPGAGGGAGSLALLLMGLSGLVRRRRR